MSRFARSPLTAVLGPTNTGKTHLAVERMLGHSSGIMGFPLRLIAREIYDRVVAAKGEAAVALVTGEERIWPETARYILCTAEAMPVTRPNAGGSGQPSQGAQAGDVAFVAIDEAQIGQDRERGHIFTSRLLHARGREETMILGSGALAPVVRSLLPEAEIVARPRFSTLSYDGPRKLSRLPPRSAIVAFSVEEVYAIAEALRRFSGGAAVVMGALSPRTRNAQVAMFQAGEVDYLVATDAIGMGLNLDIAHVAFASLNKFDGQRQRRLTIAEMAQIAGRAGRYQRDGTFGSVGAEAAFAEEEITALEEHRFQPIDWLHWRNPDPAFNDVAGLIDSLELPAPHAALRPAPEATDLAVLKRMAGDAEAMELVTDAAHVRRLWSACSLPDFLKAGPEAHGRMVARLWRDLGQGKGHIDADWFAGQLKALDVTEGAVEVLAERIAKVRTWCYIAHRPDWLADPAGMAEVARGVETRLSDALHNALTARFVDRRTSVLLRAIGQDAGMLPVAVDVDGVVRVDGEAIGRLEGFTFHVDPAARAADRRMLLAAAEKHLAVELVRRAGALAASPEEALSLMLNGEQPPTLLWHGQPVATIERGRTRLSPKIRLDPALAALDAHIVAAARARIELWCDSGIAHHLRPLVTIAARARDPEAPAPVRAVLAHIADAGGAVARDDVASSLAQMDPAARGELRALGVRIGSLDIFNPALLKPAPMRWLAALDAAWRGGAGHEPPTPGQGLFPKSSAMVPVAACYREIGDYWLRIDLVERVAQHAHNARNGFEAKRRKPKQAEAAQEAIAQAVEQVPEEVHEEVPVTPDPAAAAGDGVPAGAKAAEGQPQRAQHFAIDPELARSIGLPLESRLYLYRLLGFRTVQPPRDITVEEEPSLLWSWRGRRADQRPAPRQRSGEGAGHVARPRRAGDAGGQPSRRKDHARGAGQALKGAAARGFTSGGGKAPEPNRPRERSEPNNPFGVLAGLFGSGERE
jgi:ATP-dependent RNA helicase SUPV3L1/SUV3